MISFVCSKCGKKMTIGESSAGKTVECVGCQADIEVPDLEIEQFVRVHLAAMALHAKETRYRVGCLVWMVAIGLFVFCFGGWVVMDLLYRALAR